MQLFVKLTTGKTITLDVQETDAVLDIMKQVENREGWLIPCQRLVFSGKQLEHDKPLYAYNIKKESTIHLLGRLCGQIYVKWQGNWLQCKDTSYGFKNFFSDLTKNNVCKRKISERDVYDVPSLENQTVYHLKKIVARFLCLEHSDINLARIAQPDERLENSTLIETVFSEGYIATLVHK